MGGANVYLKGKKLKTILKQIEKEFDGSIGNMIPPGLFLNHPITIQYNEQKEKWECAYRLSK